ncbi:hypothetical protein [Nocardia acididurans]|nr:hypothetical protein [Nocardia acididurans]
MDPTGKGDRTEEAQPPKEYNESAGEKGDRTHSPQTAKPGPR